MKLSVYGAPNQNGWRRAEVTEYGWIDQSKIEPLIREHGYTDYITIICGSDQGLTTCCLLVKGGPDEQLSLSL